MFANNSIFSRLTQPPETNRDSIGCFKDNNPELTSQARELLWAQLGMKLRAIIASEVKKTPGKGAGPQCRATSSRFTYWPICAPPLSSRVPSPGVVVLNCRPGALTRRPGGNDQRAQAASRAPQSFIVTKKKPVSKRALHLYTSEWPAFIRRPKSPRPTLPRRPVFCDGAGCAWRCRRTLPRIPSRFPIASDADGCTLPGPWPWRPFRWRTRPR